MSTDWQLEHEHGVSFVAIQVSNGAPIDRHVRIENRLDGDILPPRRSGVPEEGWIDTGFDGVVPAEETLVVGYACRAPAVHPPIEVTWLGRATGATTPTPDEIVRDCGPAGPPRDAIPLESSDAIPVDAAGSIPGESSDTTTQELPSAVETWLSAVEQRLEQGEQLTNPSVTEATVCLEDLGGLTAIDPLVASLAADSQHLCDIAERIEGLRERSEQVSVPTDALRRLA